MTKLAQALIGVKRLGFDTSPIIYFVERNPAFIAVAREVFRQVDNGTITGMTGMISFAEVLVKPKSLGDAFLKLPTETYCFTVIISRSFP